MRSVSLQRDIANYWPGMNNTAFPPFNKNTKGNWTFYLTILTCFFFFRIEFRVNCERIVRIVFVYNLELCVIKIYNCNSENKVTI